VELQNILANLPRCLEILADEGEGSVEKIICFKCALYNKLFIKAAK